MMITETLSDGKIKITPSEGMVLVYQVEHYSEAIIEAKKLTDWREENDS